MMVTPTPNNDLTSFGRFYKSPNYNYIIIFTTCEHLPHNYESKLNFTSNEYIHDNKWNAFTYEDNK